MCIRDSLYGAVERVFPLVEARHQLPALYGDQQGVVEAVIVEFRHRGEVGFVCLLYTSKIPDGLSMMISCGGRSLWHVHTNCLVWMNI